MSSGDNLGDATSSIVPPFFTSPDIPFEICTSIDDEKNPTALWYFTELPSKGI